jgi:hypothetical protein
MYRFLPWWIMIAPVVLAVIDWIRMPRPRRRDG